MGFIVSPSTRHTDPLIPDQDGWNGAFYKAHVISVTSQQHLRSPPPGLEELQFTGLVIKVCVRSHDFTHTHSHDSAA